MSVRTLSKIAHARPASYAGFIVGYGGTMPAQKGDALNCSPMRGELGQCGQGQRENRDYTL